MAKGNWLRNRAAALAEVRRTGLFLLAFALSGILLFTEAITSALEPGGGGVILGLPYWGWGLVLGFAGLFWWMLEYAVQLRRRLTPNVKLSFVSGAGGLSRTKQQLYDSKTAEPMGKTDAVYVRIKVESLSEIGPKVCAPFLVRLERLGATEPQIADLHDGLQLPWAFNGVAGLPVHFKVPRFIDVLVVGERIQGLALPIPSPNSLGDFLETPGTFLVDVNVVADGVTKPIRLKVVWTGDWRTIHAEEIASQ